MAQQNDNDTGMMIGIGAVIALPFIIFFIALLPIIALISLVFSISMMMGTQGAERRDLLVATVVLVVMGVLFVESETAYSWALAVMPTRIITAADQQEMLSGVYRWSMVVILVSLNIWVVMLKDMAFGLSSTQAPAPSHGFAFGDGEPIQNPPAHDPAFDFDPSRFGGKKAAPASSSREVATVGADNDETDERLWRMAMDERTPEMERKAAMRAIKKRKKGSA